MKRSKTKKGANKGKTKVWQCAFYERECDDLGKYCWCHSPDSGIRECDCENIFVRQKCPHFKRGDRAGFLHMDKYDKQLVENYLEAKAKELKETEIRERAMLKYLKEKYER